MEGDREAGQERGLDGGGAALLALEALAAAPVDRHGLLESRGRQTGGTASLYGTGTKKMSYTGRVMACSRPPATQTFDWKRNALPD